MGTAADLKYTNFMKLKSNLLALVVLAVACTFFTNIAQARRSGTLPEDNSGAIVDNNGGTSTVSNSSGKMGGNNKVVSDVKIKLVATPEFKGAKGTARSRARTDKQDLEVEVQVAKSLAGSVLGVTIGDTVIGTITINTAGKGKLELSTEHGDVVPAIAAGTLIGVVTETGGIVLAGSF